MFRTISERSSFLLSGVIVLSFLLLPFVPYCNDSSRMLMLFYTVIIIAAPYLFIRERKFLHLLAGTGVLLCLLQLSGFLADFSDWEFMRRIVLWQDAVTLGVQLFWVGYILKSTILIQRFHEPVFSCILAYLLMGTLFGNIYYVIEHYMPGSFLGDIPARPPLNHTDLLYFSFITLTTCGYGDIIPITRFTRMLAALETICGVMYIALFVGRVISTYHPRPEPILPASAGMEEKKSRPPCRTPGKNPPQ